MSRYDNQGLTLREREILNYIIDFKTVNGFAPTISEISVGLITSRSFVRSALYKTKVLFVTTKTKDGRSLYYDQTELTKYHNEIVRYRPITCRTIFV